MRSIAALLLCALPAAAWAGRPFVTEDAGVLGKGQCELEAYLLRERERDAPSTRGGWIQPNCGFGWQTQLGIGGGRTEAGGDGVNSVALLAKTAVRELTDTQIGVALAFGAAGTKTRGQSFRHDSTAVAAVASVPLERELLLHANLGWQRSQVERRDATAWAIAIERTGAIERLDVGAEVYGDDRTPGVFYGIGARYAPLPDRLFVDFSWARSTAGARGTLTTLGIKLAF